MDVRPIELQVDRIEAADLALRTENMMSAPPSVPENEPVPLAVPPAPGDIERGRTVIGHRPLHG